MKHGGDLSDAIRRHGGAPGAWLDLSTGINPRPWPIPAVLPDAAWRRLPSRDDTDALVATAREAYRIPEDAAVVPIPGAQALIQWLPSLAAPGPVAIVGPTYTEHALCWGGSGRKVIEITALDRLPETARHAVVVNPNNPDGHITPKAVLADIAARLAARDGWLIIDESFADTDPDIGASALCVDQPVVVLRSFGKFYGLAGVRLGCAIAPPSIAARITGALGPWAVSGPALAIGRMALDDHGWAAETRRDLARRAARLDSVLAAGGLTIVGGTSLFRLARHADAGALHEHLARQHIWARRFDWSPDLLRFGLPPDEQGVTRLATALHART